ncbi:MAG: hypothetical protein A2V81_00230 [Candidatus Abawacabacteria bacterium RBG_16_42_10]|uniref:Uncharacterized protein n=1 Tax=Candidatus Abawacabacteria bacterium RBG_16_42_10 TaxID=1817814 RepID=A0A1F4XLA4_9BACT|nr:MAG: hypothetical protein A2V81_00230 [Candidatus Abawacabacteria bacterium RBG_16_42_10]
MENMGIFVPKSFAEEGIENQRPIISIQPVAILDAIFMRHGEQFSDGEQKNREDRLSEVGRVQAIEFGKSLIDRDGVFGFCGDTKRAQEYLSIILENCQAPRKGQARIHPSLNAIDPRLGSEEYETHRREQIEELASWIDTYKRSVKTMREKSRMSILFVTHTHINESLLEKIIGDPEKSALFDPTTVVRPFAPGDHWILRTSRPPNGKESSVIILGQKQYPLNEQAFSSLIEGYLARNRYKSTRIVASEQIGETNEVPLEKVFLAFSVVRDNPMIAAKPAKNEYNFQVEKRWIFCEYIKFLVQESDALAQKLGDKECSTFSRKAADVAECIKKYAQDLIHNHVHQKDAKISVSAHVGFAESFLIKCLIKIVQLKPHSQTSSAEKLIDILENGFEKNNRLQVDIAKGTLNTVHIRIRFDKKIQSTGKEFHFDGEVPMEVIEQIIAERT